MNRRHLLGAFTAIAASRALPGWAQQPGHVPRLAILFFGSRANFETRSQAFTKAMAELGYVDGKSIHYAWKTANGQEDLLASYANELSHGTAEVVLSASTHSTRALRHAGVTTPIVMASAEDPIAEGFVKSVEKPATNMTGMLVSTYDHLERHLELLMAVAPRLTRVTALVNPDNPSVRGFRGRLQSAVHAGTKLVFANVTAAEQIEAAFPSRARDDSDGLIVMNDTLLYNERRTIVESAARAKRPAVYPLRGFVDAGGLMSFGPNAGAIFTRPASFVDRILKGA